MKKQNRKIVMAVCMIFIALLVPLYWIAIYTHPCVDDYFYGTDTVKVWNFTHSLIETCKMSLENTKEVYHNWQGNFSGIFLMGLQPGIFGEKYYCWTTVIILTTFIVAHLFFYYQMMLKLLHKNKTIISILSMILTMTALQFTYMPSDSFYWYNGSIYYTFFYSLSLLLFGVLLWKQERGNISSSIVTVFAGILAFSIGGSNYSTALVSVIILFFVHTYLVIDFISASNEPGGCACTSIRQLPRGSNTPQLSCVTSLMPRQLAVGYLTWQKSKKKDEQAEEKIEENRKDARLVKQRKFRNIIENSIIFLALCSGFLISVLAPGNAIRQESVGGSNSIIKSILLSFCYGGYNIATATTLPVICMWLIMVPMLWKLIPEKNAGQKDSKKRQMSMMCGKIGLLFCIFSAQSTPVIYAQGIRIPYRLMNIIYFSYYTFGLLVWIIVLTELKQSKIWKDFSNYFEQKESGKTRKCSRYYYAAVMMALLIALVGNIKITESENEKGKAEIEGLPITAEAVFSLASGEAKGYGREAALRVEVYENENIKKVRVPAFIHKPKLLYHTDITTDKKHWKNKHVSDYYNKQYVVLEKE